ncbi:hypothetical protein ACVMAJ_000549 [Bradyrhizobium sp. USDA 4448]
MGKIILSTVTMTLITASGSHAFAAHAQHRLGKVPQATSAQIRDARNAIEQQAQPGWQYSGWSAPAGR